MAVSISTVQMAYGVYPNCKKALAQYNALVARLADGGDLASFSDYHATATAPVAAYIAQLQTAMQAICTIMEAVDAAAIAQTGGRCLAFHNQWKRGRYEQRKN